MITVYIKTTRNTHAHITQATDYTAKPNYAYPPNQQVYLTTAKFLFSGHSKGDILLSLQKPELTRQAVQH
jgi:hypothetical protein